ncbi:hypothetical protein [Pseudomonas sp. UMAB-40]|uniref:hypothetical protein n=1 Tax=Pseudomonas sp. UMAB-40 TaxID=1365407 RepID=UPI001C57DB47|nr:hypothetical protein [Pseudomonas sp. UMAB-40]
MSQLENTMIHAARQELEVVKDFYVKRAQGVVTQENRDDFLLHLYSMLALLKFGNQDDTGMSAEGAQALREIEQEHAAAFAASMATTALQPK